MIETHFKITMNMYLKTVIKKVNDFCTDVAIDQKSFASDKSHEELSFVPLKIIEFLLQF